MTAIAIVRWPLRSHAGGIGAELRSIAQEQSSALRRLMSLVQSVIA